MTINLQFSNDWFATFMMNEVIGLAFKLQLYHWYILALLDFYFSCSCYWPHKQNALSAHLGADPAFFKGGG